MTVAGFSPEFLALQTSVAGRYSLVRELGRGGMGVVFLAREVALDRLVAIKLLPSGLAAQPALRERFIREARTAAQLSHPHIVAIHAVEATDAVVFFVMEYVAGETLGDRLRRDGAISPGEALRITQEVAWALAHAHARGVVHRDVKPDNILLEEGTDRAMVTDFGIAHAGTSNDTPAGVGLGTFHYMSPEQAAGRGTDARTDVYALGVTAFQAVTGRRPFEGYDGAALLAQQAHVDPPSVTALVPTLQLRFAAVIDRAIQLDASARWDSVEAMAQELSAARAVVPPQPVALATFARESRELMGQAGFAASLAVLAELTFAMGFGFDDIAGILFHTIATLLVAMSLTSLGRVVGSARTVLRRGYRPAAALNAVRAEAIVQSGHLGAVPRHKILDHPGIVIGVVVALAGIGGALVNAVDAFLPAILLLAIALIVPATMLQRYMKRRSGGTFWARLLEGRAGRWLFRVAGIGLGVVRAEPTSGEPTTIALGGAVGEIFARLSESQQRSLAAVPDLVERLEALALERGAPRRIEAVMALETLRLDLLRLQAGEVAADSITQGLEQLERFGRQVDAVLELREDDG